MAVANPHIVSRRWPPEELGSPEELPRIEILGQPIIAATVEVTLAHIRSAAQAGPIRIAYVNAHTLNLACADARLREALCAFEFVLNDGVGVALAARLRARRFPANLHGSSFNTHILQMAAEECWPVFLLGARPGVAKSAREELAQAIPGLEIVGARHGYHHRSERDLAAVEASGAQVVLVGMGNPLQELWLAECFCRLPSARIGVGVGAYLDFQARAVRRAPGWLNQCGLEWAYRLAQEPRRLAGRYLLEGPQFLLRAFRGSAPLQGDGHR